MPACHHFCQPVVLSSLVGERAQGWKWGGLRVVALLCAIITFGATQDALSQPASNSTLPPVPPPMSAGASRVSFFRKLIAMTPAERDAEYVQRKSTPQDRQVFERKIQEFEQLTPEQREARFLALQRQLDFRLLIRLPESNRAQELAQLSEADRAWQTQRLAQWDKVPADLQAMIFTNLTVLSFLFPEGASAPGRSALELPFLTPAQHNAMEKAVTAWNQLPADKRQAISNHFCNYFTLDDKTRSNVLHPLTPGERQLMQKSLAKFKQLPPAQQASSMSGFQKFANLSPSERQEFLRNAEEWQKMSPQDRQIWRELVNHDLLPPSPPGMEMESGPMPPMPPAPTSSDSRGRPRKLPLAATNR